MLHNLESTAPIFFIILIGYVFNLFFKIRVKDLSKVYLYILSPSLIFKSLLATRLTAVELLNVVLFVVVLIASILLLVTVISRIFKWDRKMATVIKLGTIFMNPGNIGLMLVLFTVGDVGVEIGVVYLLVQAILHYSLGIYIATEDVSLPQRIREILRLPFPYVALAAIILRVVGWPVPSFIESGIDILSESAIPLSTLVLGMLLTRVKFKLQMGTIVMPVLIRLVVSPLLAFLWLKLIPVSPVTAGVLVLLAATPSSINSVIIATEYEVMPELASSINLSSTLLSMLTLPIVVHIFFG